MDPFLIVRGRYGQGTRRPRSHDGVRPGQHTGRTIITGHFISGSPPVPPSVLSFRTGKPSYLPRSAMPVS